MDHRKFHLVSVQILVEMSSRNLILTLTQDKDQNKPQTNQKCNLKDDNLNTRQLQDCVCGVVCAQQNTNF
jgi:hypothetical protein